MSAGKERQILLDKLGGWYAGEEDDYWDIGSYRIRRTLKDKENKKARKRMLYVERDIFLSGRRVATVVDFLAALRYIDQMMNGKENERAE